MPAKSITLTVTGPFADSAIALIVALLRALDTRADMHYELLVNDPDSSISELEQKMRAAMPNVPGRETKFSIHRKQ